MLLDPNANERVIWKRSGALPGLELMCGFQSARHWKVFHETYVLSSCAAASSDWRYRNEGYFLDDGSNALMEPGESHVNLRVHKPSDFTVLFVDPETFCAAARDLGLRSTPHFPRGQTEDPRLFAALHRLSSALDADTGRLALESAAADCLRLMLQFAERPPETRDLPNSRPAVAKAVRHLQARYAESVGLAELATVAGMSPYHLVRTFARAVGVPPHAYQNLIRIERARLLLRAGRTPAEVAADVGFADQSHLTRHFKRAHQVTPAAYARAGR